MKTKQTFKDGKIEGVIVRPLSRYSDDRGWLMELFRHDELDNEYFPAMAYMSLTRPGVARGPHEHRDQADLFCFAGPSSFKVYLWDNRSGASTYGVRQVFVAGAEAPTAVIVPKGVVHAYKNVGGTEGLVINCPNRLFKGEAKKEPVDELRYEDDPDTPYILD